MTSKLSGVLYKLNVTGSVQQWQIERLHNRFRTRSGQVGGKITISAWTVCEGKNIGRSNETTPDQQAQLEVSAKYKRKTEQGYCENINNIHETSLFKPMLAHKYEIYPTGTGSPYVFSQPKLDGIRMVANKHRLATRTGKPILSVPHIKEALEPYFTMFPDHIFDGELYSHKMRDNFEGLVSIARKVKPTAEDLKKSLQLEYHIYDVFIESKPDLDYSGRLNELQKLLPPAGQEGYIKEVEVYIVKTQEELDQCYQSYMIRGYEGQMVRLNGFPYENKRSKSLLKRKEFNDAEFDIVDIIEGKGQWSGYAKSIELRLPNDDTFNAGVKGTREFCKEVVENAEDYIGKQATVRYQGWSRYGVPRFPVVRAFHKEERM